MRGPLPGSLCGGGGQRWDAAAGREKERADGGNYEARLATREDLDAPMAPRSLNQGSLEPYLETTCSRTGGKPPVPHSARLEGRLSLEPKWLRNTHTHIMLFVPAGETAAAGPQKEGLLKKGNLG